MSISKTKPGMGHRLMHASMASVIYKLRLKGILPRLPDDDTLFDQIPAITLNKLVDKPVIKVDGTYSYRDGYLPWCDVTALLSVLVECKPKTIVEIGTFNGYTTRLMAINLPGAHIHTIDLPEDFQETGAGLEKDDWHLISSRRVGSEYRADSSITSITQHFGDTAEYPFPAAEFYFIDGSHTYAYVRNDTEKALACAETKVIMWHDCDPTHADVNRWLHEMVQSGSAVRRIQGTHLAILDLRSPAPLV